MSRKINKFFVNYWFSKTIINKNKDKIKPLVNAISNKFLREIFVLNIISLTKTRQVIIKKCGTTNYSNYYLVLNNFIDILKLVELLIKDSIFKK